MVGNEPAPFQPHSPGTRIAHARRLLGVREGRDVTVPELAERVGVSAESVYNWESDKPISEKNLAKVAEELGVTPAYLRYGVKEATAAGGVQEIPTTAYTPIPRPEKAAAKKVAKPRKIPVTKRPKRS